jgi:hypothetical protein
MIYREKILAALNDRKTEFSLFKSESSAQFADYRRALDRAASMGREELARRLEAVDSPGAMPTGEFEGARPFVIPFAREWRSHEEARAWAYQTLLARTTFAADGSQILPTKDFSVPVAAVQVGWFENSHLPGGAYIKDAAFEVLTPAEIMVRGATPEPSEQVVHRRRYALEIDVIKNFILTTAARRFDPSRPPVVFFDSLLVITFAELLPEDQRKFYVSEITSLLDASRKAAVPVIGYVDTSFARDLVAMLKAALGLADSDKIHDAALIAPLMKWGDRTPLFQCKRRGILDDYGDAWRGGVGFVYLKTVGDRPPARLDLPLWVYERGLLDYVIDTVRAEVVVGNGYPYAIETADATAVISVRDRELFYALFQEFADREQLDLRMARKAISKAHRR